MTRKRLLVGSVTLALLTLLTVGLLQLAERSDSSVQEHLSKLTVAQMRASLTSSPPPLAALHAQASELLGDGSTELRARLKTLRGDPVVINKWASWCGPCQAEFGVFAHASVNLGHTVAFLGIDSLDPIRSQAITFLDSHPLSYPSYYDPSGRLGEAITGSSFMPVTVFYDRKGHSYIRQGTYPSLAKLEADVKLYALDS
ncbi:MAG TPA: TlpA disulfide reductase family protein [Solirubrobacteraceae bacterium]|jgi:thiol-disulfide isomerase/thioredoxin